MISIIRQLLWIGEYKYTLIELNLFSCSTQPVHWIILHVSFIEHIKHIIDICERHLIWTHSNCTEMWNTVCPSICEDVLHSHTWKTRFIITAITILQTIDVPSLRWQAFLWFQSCCYANRYPGDLVVFSEVKSSCRQAATHAGFDSKAFTNTDRHIRILQSFISTPWYFYKLHTHGELLRWDHLL